jgi:hypothetical protein
MAECNELEFELPGFSGRKIESNFEGGNVSRKAVLRSPRTGVDCCR